MIVSWEIVPVLNTCIPIVLLSIGEKLKGGL